MNNYEYIIASLPDLTTGWKFGDKGPEDYIHEILDLCSDNDRKVIDFLLKGCEGSNLDAGFYTQALKHKNCFIREYFLFDLNVRNAKVRYLNRALERPADMDVISLNADDDDTPAFDEVDFAEKEALEAILNGNDILARERGMDDLIWDKISSLTTFNYFDINAILGFIAKLNIVSRWYRLDEQTGREMFRRLVSEVRGTFKGVEYNDK